MSLKDKYEQLSEKLHQAEEYFHSLHLPEPVKVPCGKAYLAWCRHDGHFRLCHGVGENVHGEGWKPVVECSTTVRLLAVGCLGELKATAITAARNYVEQIDNALKQVDDFLAGP